MKHKNIERVKKTEQVCSCACHRIVPDEMNNCDCIKNHKK